MSQNRIFKSGIALSIGAWLCLPLAACAQIKIDFQQRHTFLQVASSGVKMRDFDGDKLFHTLQVDSVILKLPGGQEVQAKAQLASFTTDPDGTLTTLEIHGPVLPDDEAYQVALIVHQAFSIPTDRLEQWRKDIVGKGRDAPTFTNARNDYYPNVFVEMASSMNPLYPWFVRIEIGWNALDDDKRDEAWGKANNPRAPAGLERISLDSPTGKTYDRKDAYAHLKKLQEDLDRRLGQVRGVDGYLINAPHAPQPPIPKQAPEPKSAPPTEVPDAGTPWLLVAVLIGAAMGLLWLVLKRQK